MSEEHVPIPSFMPTDEPAIKQFHYDQKQIRQKHGIAATIVRKDRGTKFIENQEREAVLAEQTMAVFDAGTPQHDEQRKRLALALMYLGRFDQARTYATDDGTLGRINAMANAVDTDDKAGCECGENDDEALHRFIHSGVWVQSEKHGKIMPVRECANCGGINATLVIPPVPSKEEVERAEKRWEKKRQALLKEQAKVNGR